MLRDVNKIPEITECKNRRSALLKQEKSQKNHNVDNIQQQTKELSKNDWLTYILNFIDMCII